MGESQFVLSDQERRASLYLTSAALAKKFLDLDHSRGSNNFDQFVHMDNIVGYMRYIETEMLRLLKKDEEISGDDKTGVEECFIASFMFSTLIDAEDRTNFFSYLTQAVAKDVMARPLEWSRYLEVAKYFVEG